MNTTSPIQAYLYFPKYEKLFSLVAGFSILLMAISIPTSASLTDISFAGAGIVSLLFIRWTKLLPFLLRNHSIKLWLALILLFVIGLSYSQAPFSEQIHFLGKYSKLLWALLSIPLFADKKNLRLAFWAYFSVMLITLLISLALYLGFLPSTDQFNAESVFRDHIDQNLLMSFFAYLVALEIQKNNRYKWLWIGLFILTVHQIFFISGGRTGYITFLATMLLIAWNTWHWKGIIIACLSCLITAPVIYHYSDVLKDRMHLAVQDVHQFQKGQEVTSVGLRMAFARNSVQLFKQSPIYGHGTGSFAWLYAKNFPNTDAPTRNPHNEYLGMAVQFGVIGLTVFLLFIIFNWCDAYQLSDYPQQVLQGLTITFALGSLANSWLLDMTPGHLWMFWLAWSLAQSVLTERSS